MLVLLFFVVLGVDFLGCVFKLMDLCSIYWILGFDVLIYEIFYEYFIFNREFEECMVNGIYVSYCLFLNVYYGY